MLAPKPDNLSLIPGTHMVEGKKVALWLPYTWHSTCYTHTHTHNILSHTQTHTLMHIHALICLINVIQIKEKRAQPFQKWSIVIACSVLPLDVLKAGSYSCPLS